MNKEEEKEKEKEEERAIKVTVMTANFVLNFTTLIKLLPHSLILFSSKCFQP